MTITVELSWPEPCLWPNARPDRRAKAAVARQGRNEGYVMGRKALDGSVFVPLDVEIPVRLIGHLPAARRYDRDNFLSACKSRLDGIAQALMVDDARFNPHVEWGDLDAPHGKVIVEIEP